MTARHRSWADSISLNAIASPAAREPGPLVTLVRSRTVENVDSIGYVVLRWIPTNWTATTCEMNVSLPDEMRAFVDEQVDEGRYGSTSEYVRELIRRDQDRQRLRRVLLDGAQSAAGPLADDAYFTTLRRRVNTTG